MSKVTVICTHSRRKTFKTGNSYDIVDGMISTELGISIKFAMHQNGDEYTIPFAEGSVTFSSAVAKKEKSLLKMLVRAHVNYAKARGWGDSKNGSNKSWKRSGYKSAKDWARCFSLGYDLKAIRDDAEAEGQPLDQEFVNWFIDEQMSYF